MNEIGLPAQKGRRLQHVDHRGHGGNIFGGVHVGEDRHTDLPAHFVKQLETRIDAGAAHRFTRAAIGLVVRRLENVRHAKATADVLHVARHLDAQFQRLGRARAGDQEQRLVETDFKSAEFHAQSSSPERRPFDTRVALLRANGEKIPFVLSRRLCRRIEAPVMACGDSMSQPFLAA